MAITKLPKLLRKPDNVAGSSAPATMIGLFVAFGGILFGYDTGTISGILAMTYFRKQFSTGYLDSRDGLPNLTAPQSSLLVSILSAGTFFGSLVAAPMGDRLGRRPSLIIAIGMFTFGVSLQIASAAIPLFLSGRLLAGLGVGIVSVLVPLYQSEMAPKWIRGTLVCGYQLAITTGLLIASVINNFTSTIDSPAAYRIPIGLQFVWAFILFLGLCLLPETPRYLIKTGQHDRASLSLSRLRRLDITHPALIEEIADIEANHAYELSLGPSTYMDCIFGTPHLGRRLLTGCCLQMLQQLTGCNFIFYYGTTFFRDSGMSTSPFIVNLITNIVNVSSTVLSLSLVESWGRRRLLMVGAFGMTISTLIVASVGTAGSTSEIANKVLIAFVCLYIFFFAASWGPVAWVVTSEIFPLKSRAKSMSITTAANWLLNWAIAYASPYMVGSGIGTANIGTKIFFIWGSFCVISFIFAYTMVYETSKMSLEQIDELYEVVHRAWNSKNYQPSWSFQDLRDDTEAGVSGAGTALQLRDEEARRQADAVEAAAAEGEDSDAITTIHSGTSASSKKSQKDNSDDKVWQMAEVDFTI